MRKIIIACLLCGLLALSGLAQKVKQPWNEWPKNEVDKMLPDSPWSHTQSENDPTEMTFLGALSSAAGMGPARNQTIDLKYRIRLFSAKPIRGAFARTILLGNPNLKAVQLQNFVDGDYSESIVVAVNFESNDGRISGPVSQLFGNANAAMLKANTYLERKDGKRVFLGEYSAPTSDGTGAKFVFPRNLDGKPYIVGPEEVVRFVTDLGKGIKMSWKFKAAEMMYDGKLEF
ncbi:hypothetical protein BH10ACI2_BH10ACI2_21110 [soil metagenome]